MSQPYATPFEANAADGGLDYARGFARDACPFPDAASRDLWCRQWDAAALEAGRVARASGICGLYRAALDVAALLRDLRERPRTLSVRSPRFRDCEIALTAALARVQAATAPPTPTETPATPEPTKGERT